MKNIYEKAPFPVLLWDIYFLENIKETTDFGTNGIEIEICSTILSSKQHFIRIRTMWLIEN